MKPAYRGIAYGLLALAPAVGWAGGKASIESSSGSNTVRGSIEYDGKGAVRMDLSGEAGNYMLARDGKVYSIISQGGQPRVLDMGGMMKTMGGIARQQMQQPMAGSRNVADMVSLRATGASETVAGIEGRVYDLTYVDDAGTRRSETLVLSTDPRARELSRAMFAMSKTIVQSMQVDEPPGNAELEREIASGKHGILRFGGDFRVISFDDGSPAASRFALPAEPAQLPDFGKMMGR